MDKKISVVIPFYNLGKYLDEAVDSIRTQTYQDWELLIVDDGSTDHESLNILKKHEIDSDSRIQVFHKENEGLPSTRNYGIERAKGEYICCLDADDKYAPEFLSKSSAILNENKTLGFVTTWFQPFGEISGESTTVQIKKNTNLLLVKNIPHVASMFRKKAWKDAKGYEIQMKHGYQDWDFWLSVIEAGYDWDVISEILFFYRVRSDSMLRETSKKDVENYEFILNKHKKLLQNSDVIEMLKSARKIIFDYDLIINNLNKENLKLKNSGSIFSKIKKSFI